MGGCGRLRFWELRPWLCWRLWGLRFCWRFWEPGFCWRSRWLFRLREVPRPSALEVEELPLELELCGLFEEGVCAILTAILPRILRDAI